MKSPVVLLSSFLDDVKRLEPDVKGLDRDIITIESRFKHEGIGFLSVTLSSLCDSIDYGLANGSFACPTSFAKIRGGAIPRFLQGLLCKVFDPRTGRLLDDPQVSIVKCLREILRSFKKVTCSSRRERKLHDEAVQGFLETDRRIVSNSFSKPYVNLLESVSKLLLPGLYNFDPYNLPCRHGPGGVAERLRPNQKWLGLTSDAQSEFLMSKYGLDILASKSGSVHDVHNIETATLEQLLYDADVVNGLVPQLASTGLAKLLSVPKSSSARRTITMEPVMNMYIQQGLNAKLRDSISQCSVLRRCLSLSDQSKNQNLARIGSITGKYATIDLSSASDLLDLRLVKLIFANKVDFLTSMLDCRSSHVDCDSVTIELMKFAGMGNALTFPVQSIAFAVLAICAILCDEGHRPSYSNVKRAAARVRVYGDDIIVPSKHASRVFEWLAHFGLKVNQGKSFTTGNFRESCGLDAFMGFDVTPTYVRDWPFTSARSSDLLASLVSFSNQTWLKGLYSVANTARSIVEETLGTLPLVSQRSASLGWHSRVDTSVAQKWDEKLQRLVFRGYVLVARKRDDRIDDYAALGKSLHQLDQRSNPNGHVTGYPQETSPNLGAVSREKDHLVSSVLRFHTRIRKQWMPAHAGW